MKNNILLFILSCSAIIFTGCSDFLDRRPYSSISESVIWNSDASATMAVNGIYAAANQSTTLMGVPYYFTWWGPDGFNYFRDSQVELDIATNRYGNFLNLYTAYYKIIRYANDAITNLTDNQKVSSDLASRLIGEAEFLRGISYFYLWQLYGGVIILDSVLAPKDTYLPRNSADEVKEFIIKDFTDAIDRLPVSYSSSDWGRATKGAAIAMLGKTYLYDSQWENAAEQFAKLMDSPFSYSLVDDYSQLFDFHYEQNSEVVFSMQEEMQSGMGSDYDQWYGGRSLFPYGQSFCMASNLVFDTYTYSDGSEIDISTRPKRSDYDNEDDYGVVLMQWYKDNIDNKSVDKRLDANILRPLSKIVGKDNVEFQVYWPYQTYANADPPAYRIEFSSYAIYSWRKYVTTGNDNTVRWDSPTDIPIIRYADVLLMYAEALNESKGAVSEVYDAVNLVRRRAGLADLPSGLNQDSMREYIWLERYHEFPGEGILFFDVRRWKTAATTDPIFGLNHDVLDFRGEKLFTRVFTEKDYLFPIPQAEIELNDKLTQNPGWE